MICYFAFIYLFCFVFQEFCSTKENYFNHNFAYCSRDYNTRFGFNIKKMIFR